jgi:hypothetical protein
MKNLSFGMRLARRLCSVSRGRVVVRGHSQIPQSGAAFAVSLPVRMPSADGFKTQIE